VCEPSGKKSCVADRVACDADSDCPSGWSCADNPEGVCWSGPNGDMGCSPGDPPKLCMPPYVNLGGGYPTRGEDSNGSGSGSPGTPTSPGDAAGSPNPGSVPPGFEDENETASNSDAESDSGCSVALGPTPGSGASGLAALGALVALVLGRSVRTRRASR
jgi:MYXO-CTERM domain-containing protein